MARHSLRRWRHVAALGAAAFGGAVAIGHVRRSREHIAARVAPEWRSPAAYLDTDFVRPWMLDAVAKPSRRVARPLVAGVRMRVHSVQTPTGHFHVEQMEPDLRTSGGALLWIHGGGHVLGGAGTWRGTTSFLAREAGCPVFSVDYRLGAFPRDFDDCVAALEWLLADAGRLGVDPGRVVVGGDSAGGGLAASVAQWAVDHDVALAFQLLEYPMLDDRTVTRPVPEGRGEIGWTPHLNRLAWADYLGREPGGEDERRPYAVPARRTDLSGLPPAWIGVGDMDLFLDEDREYAGRLSDAGVAVDFHVEPGMFHGADSMAPVGNSFHRLMAGVLREVVVG